MAHKPVSKPEGSEPDERLGRIVDNMAAVAFVAVIIQNSARFVGWLGDVCNAAADKLDREHVGLATPDEGTE